MAGQLRARSFLLIAGFQLVLTGCATGSGPIGLKSTAPSLSAKAESGTPRLQKEDKIGPPLDANDKKSKPTNVVEPPDGEFSVRVLAKVNGIAILDEELKSATYSAMVSIAQKPEPERSELKKKILEQALEQLIDREVILQDAVSRLQGPAGKKVIEKLKGTAGKEFDKKVVQMKKMSRAKTDGEFKQILRQQGQSLAVMRRQYERQLLATEYMRFKVSSMVEKIGLSEVREYYESHPEQFQRTESVTWQDIFLASSKYGSIAATRRVAQAIARKAKGGEDFVKLADEYDDGDSKFRGGAGYGQRKGDIKPPEVEPYLFKMKDGEVGPLVELQTGVHVIRLIKHQRAGLKPFDEKTQNLILTKLKNETAEREWKRLVKELRAKAVIETMGK